MTKQLLAAIVALAAVAAVAAVLLVSSLGGEATATQHPMPGGMPMEGATHSDPVHTMPGGAQPGGDHGG